MYVTSLMIQRNNRLKHSLARPCHAPSWNVATPARSTSSRIPWAVFFFGSIGPPNQGSEVVDAYADFPGFEYFGGPAGLQLGTGESSIPRHLGPVAVDVGIIAGTRSINPILSTLLPDKDDGKVSVASTRVEGMNDHIELPVNHVFMMRNEDVFQQIIHYLEYGAFDHGVN